MVLVFLIFLASASASTGPATKCRVNETFVECKVCPQLACNISYTEYTCGPDPKPCVSGCDCIQDYLRTNEGVCVLNEDCPPPPENPPTGEPTGNPSPPTPPSQGPSSQASSSATSTAYAQSSNKKSESKATASSFSSTSSTRSSSFSSASSSASSYAYSNTSNNGSGKPGPQRNCTYNRCTPTCSLPNPENCPQDSNPCNCPTGTIISDVGGQCVPREECQKYINCKGDYNASYTDCPIACPSTCAKPDAEYCNTQCGTLGCECDPGYILTETNGRCILPDDCPGGYPCGQNETFVGCLIRCPNIYCPVDDSRGVIICDPARPCPSGCGCKRNYRRKSVDEYVCILASECPAVNCTRPNEEWSKCPEPCFSDYCRDRNKVTAPGDCPSSGPDCQPQCVCKEGYFRNASAICVSAQECPPDN